MLLEEDGGLVPEGAEGGEPAEEPDDEGEAVLLAQPVQEGKEGADQQAPEDVDGEGAEGEEGEGVVLLGGAGLGLGEGADREGGAVAERGAGAAGEEDDEQFDEQGGLRREGKRVGEVYSAGPGMGTAGWERA